MFHFSEYNYLTKQSFGKNWWITTKNFAEFAVWFIESLFQYPKELLFTSEKPHPFMVYHMDDWTDNDFGHIADLYYLTNYFQAKRYVLVVAKYDLEEPWGAFVEENAHYGFRNRVFLFREHNLMTDEVVDVPDSPNVLQRHEHMWTTLLELSKKEDKERRSTMLERVEFAIAKTKLKNSKK